MIVVATTLTTYAMSDDDCWSSWLKNAEKVKETYQRFASTSDVKYFVAIEIDDRKLVPFEKLMSRLSEISGEHWTYSLNDGRKEVTTKNRLRHIVVGQNLVMDYCVSDPSVSHLLFLAADCSPPDDILPRMLEMNHPLCAPYINTYGLRGPAIDDYPYPVMSTMASAACIFIARSVFSSLRWRWDLDTNMTDDPCFHHDALHYLRTPTHVREDCVARHFPETIGAIETRGYDMRVEQE